MSTCWCIYSYISKRGKAKHPLSPPLLPLLHPLPAGWKVPLDEAELKPTELFPLPVFFPLWLLPWLEDFLPFTSDRPTSEVSLLPSWWLVEPWQQQTQRSLPQARCGHSRGSFGQFPLKRSNCPLCPQSDAQVMLLSRKKPHFPLLLFPIPSNCRKLNRELTIRAQASEIPCTVSRGKYLRGLFSQHPI